MQDRLLFKLWAKSDPVHPLPCHMVDVGSVALQLLESGPFTGTVPRFHRATGCPIPDVGAWMAYLASLHDLGKCRANFQANQPDMVKALVDAGLDCRQSSEHYRHEALSAQWLQEHLTERTGWSSDSAATVGDAIRGHHGNFSVDDPSDEVPIQHAQWEPLRRDLERAMWSVFAPSQWQADFADHSVAGLLLSGLLVLSDWIASNSELFPMAWEGEEIAAYAVKSRHRAREAVHRLGLDGESRWLGPSSFREMFPNIQRPRPVQQACEELIRHGVEPGLAIIEAPMGEGKSEAAVYLATQWMTPSESGGIYLALPTAATSNQMHGRFKEIIHAHDPMAAENVRLVHGTSWLIDDATPELCPQIDEPGSSEHGGELALDWFRPKKRSLLARYGVGTIDQAMMGAMHVKHGFLRLYGLAGKVLIVDEVHAYDTYMTQILTRLLAWCRALSIPTILLSATLPAQRKQQLAAAYHPRAHLPELAPGTMAPYPLITSVGNNGATCEWPVEASSRRQEVDVHKQWGLLGNPITVAQLVANRVAGGGCLCVIANTVDSAQAIYRELNAILPREGEMAVELLLFHGRFPVAARQNVEERTLRFFDKRSTLPEGAVDRTKRPARAVLVATQVVEQSLDLDFDEMFSELAPIDLLLQRTGRLHRHDRPGRPGGDTPQLHVLLPASGSTDFGRSVYHKYILLRTLATFQGTARWLLPQQIRELVEEVYGQDCPALSPFRTEIDAARPDWEQSTDKDGKKAKPYLIPEPYPRAFKLARKSGGTYDENEGDAASYFAISTRSSDDSIKVLIAEGDAWREQLHSQRSPVRTVLQEIYMQTVGIPRWWLRSVEPERGFEPPTEAPRWLPGTMVMRFQGGCWHGHSADGTPFQIVNDPVYGLMRKEEGRG